MTATLPLDFHHHFYNLQDPRVVSRTDFRLLDLVFIALCATIAGANDWPQIEIWAEAHKDWLARFCHLPDGKRTPSHDTFERLFRRLSPQVFARCFRRWTVALGEGLCLKLIAIDGKTLRGSDRSGGTPALHLVSAWAVENHLSLAQVAVDQKSNEITAIPTLLELLELKGALVTLDAMGCQKKIAQQIVEQEGDYALVVKQNQGHLHQDIELTFAYALEMNLDADLFRFDHYREENRGHGRIERREYLVLSNLGLIRDQAAWSQLTVIGRCLHEREIDGVVSTEVRYFIGSRAAGAQEYGAAMRGHWGIENNLHWQLDVSFGEDRNRVADRHGAENLALLRRLSVGLLKRHPSNKSMANKRYSAAVDVEFLEEVLELDQLEEGEAVSSRQTA